MVFHLIERSCAVETEMVDGGGGDSVHIRFRPLQPIVHMDRIAADFHKLGYGCLLSGSLWNYFGHVRPVDGLAEVEELLLLLVVDGIVAVSPAGGLGGKAVIGEHLCNGGCTASGEAVLPVNCGCLVVVRRSLAPFCLDHRGDWSALGRGGLRGESLANVPCAKCLDFEGVVIEHPLHLRRNGAVSGGGSVGVAENSVDTVVGRKNHVALLALLLEKVSRRLGDGGVYGGAQLQSGGSARGGSLRAAFVQACERLPGSKHVGPRTRRQESRSQCKQSKAMFHEKCVCWFIRNVESHMQFRLSISLRIKN